VSARGWQARILPTKHLDELRQEIKGRLTSGEVDAELYRTYLAKFETAGADIAGARSIVLVALPQPQTVVGFTWQGERVIGLIPPTYLERQASRQVRQALEDVSAPGGYWLEEVALPKKLLATRSGLAAYGRNNITYVTGMGSFCGLVTFLSDLPAGDDCWQEPRMLDLCHKCSACLRRCPSGAINANRFLIHAERCLTFHNEKPSPVPFPVWIDPNWHNSLVGCILCQRVCPENRRVRDWVEEGPEFTEDETAQFVSDVPLDRLQATTVRKLQQVDMDGYIGVISRNLKALFHQQSQ
jgi:epoxyqueuosine reductase